MHDLWRGEGNLVPPFHLILLAASTLPLFVTLALPAFQAASASTPPLRCGLLMQPTPASACGPHKAAMVAAEGGKMRLLTYLELSRYSKAQLWDLHRQMLSLLPMLRDGTEARENVLMNIRHIKLFLARPSYAP
jgi:hypothetical protein